MSARKPTQSKKRSPASTVIDLCLSSDDEKPAATPGLKSVRKRLKTDLNSKSPPKIKSEPICVDSSDEDFKMAPSSAIAASDEVEVVARQPEFHAAAAASNNASRSSETANSDDDDGVELVGFANETRLPHNRQNCPDNTFVQDMLNGNLSADIRQKALDGNQKFCDLCYCYVCDKPASECASWTPPAGARASTRTAHCHACDKGIDAGMWKQQRRLSQMKDAPPAEPTLDTPTAGLILDALILDADGYEALTNDASHHFGFVLNNETLPPGNGPWEPTNARALDCENRHLVKCRKCGWFSHMHKSSRDFLFCADWCHACGRVARDRAFRDIEQADKRKPQPGDVHLGQKVIPFRIHSHDPRKIEAFRNRWQNSDPESPEWTFSESDHDHETFNHLIGRRPFLPNMMKLLSPLSEDKIPDDGRFNTRETDHPTNLGASSWRSVQNKVFVGECCALIIPNESHRMLLYEACQWDNIGRKVIRRTEYGYHVGNKALFGNIEADWDVEIRRGEFRVDIYLSADAAFSGRTSTSRRSISKFLALWYEMAPYKACDLLSCSRPFRNLHPKREGYIAPHCLSVPPFSISNDEFDKALKSGKAARKRIIEDFNNVLKASSEKLLLTSSSIGPLGGICASTGNDLAQMLKNYFSELILDDIRGCNPSSEHWVEQTLGLISNHRGMKKCQDACLRASLNIGDTKFKTYVRNKDQPILFSENVYERVLQKFKRNNTLHGIMIDLENLGHPAVEFVEGLNMELLPFQRQSVGWALEREKTPGGLQSFLWAKLPAVMDTKTDVYFSPILDRFRKSKPKLVRGGLIAEMMGLGKTVISLALILMNPAPETPKSGIPVPATMPRLRENEPSVGWDPDLDRSLDRTRKKKKATIISRGTLVVCHVSLVGQWIEEAKSKLVNPGLVYPYHGQSRKRNPDILSKNAIVVTTYATLSSDANYHSNKSSDEMYCPPCEQIRWWRIICDESHSLKGETKQTKAAMDLVADHRWCVTGTPMQTSIFDLKNQMKFIGIEEIGNLFSVFSGTALRHVSDRSASSRRSQGDDNRTLGPFMFFMRNVMMRHSTNQKYGGTGPTLMQLPPKTERTIEIEFTAAEEREYKKLENAAKSFYLGYRESNSRLSEHFLVLSSGLMPLRIACAGGKVPKQNPEDNKRTRKPKATGDDDDNGGEKKKTKKVVEYLKFSFRSKFKTLLNELIRIRDSESDSKSLVFSQFASTLAFLQEELPQHGFQFRTLSGDMSMKQRAKALDDFQNDPPTTVFLLSMRAGACGINLTNANRVFLMEPSLNPGLEAQAIGRVCRLGQKRNVEIVRLVMKNTIDVRVLKVVEGKFGSAGENEKANGDGDGDGDKKPAAKKKKTEGNDAFVGHMRTEKATVVKEEFDLLYGLTDALEKTDSEETKKDTDTDTDDKAEKPATAAAYSSEAWYASDDDSVMGSVGFL